MKSGYLDFSEPITKICISETISKSGCKVEHMIINDKWKVTLTNNPDKPFRKRKIAKHDNSTRHTL